MTEINLKDRFSGDPKLTLDEKGANLTYINGQPVMDKGIENMIMITLGSNRGWWGNSLMDKPSKKLDSRLEEYARHAITVDELKIMRNEILRITKWMKDEKIAGEIECVIDNPRGNQIDYYLVIKPPEDEMQLLLLTKNGINWIYQKLDPANLKV